jgi:hypothetical protein
MTIQDLLILCEMKMELGGHSQYKYLLITYMEDLAMCCIRLFKQSMYI